jgi:hypothetical protein
MKCLNMGWASRFRPDCANFDPCLTAPAVEKWDIYGELLFSDGFFAVLCKPGSLFIKAVKP